MVITDHNQGDVIKIPQNTLIHTVDGYTYSLSKPSYGIFIDVVEGSTLTCKVLLDDRFFYVNLDNICKWRKNG